MLPDDAFVVGFLGGVDPRKGLSAASAAVAAISDARLLMAGPGSDGYTDRLLGPRLRVMGMLTDLDDFWSAIDVLAVPSAL